jgi:hypothetical protein
MADFSINVDEKFTESGQKTPSPTRGESECRSLLSIS